MAQTLLVALGVALFLEGAVVALFGKRYFESYRYLERFSDKNLRILGLAIAAGGVLWVSLFL